MQLLAAGGGDGGGRSGHARLHIGIIWCCMWMEVKALVVLCGNCTVVSSWKSGDSMGWVMLVWMASGGVSYCSACGVAYACSKQR
jgi:hypothetical protein